MAYLKLGCIKEATGHNNALGLKRCIKYIFNPEKTDGNRYIGGYNISVTKENCISDAYSRMLATKRLFGKEWGRQGYHYKLSFAENDDVTPELAMRITEEFLRRCLNGYECAYAVHTNTKHLHSHMVFNSVDASSGMKYRYEKHDWAKYYQPALNDICKKYGLSELSLNVEEEKRKKKKNCEIYKKYKKDDGYTREKIACDVEECISRAESYEDFVILMQSKGHIYNDSGKYITVTAPGMKKATRLKSLTPDGRYTRENIKNLTAGIKIDREEVRKKLFREFDAYEKSVKEKCFYKYDIAYAKALEEQTLMRIHGINDKQALDAYKAYLNAADKELNIMRKNLNRILARYSDSYKKLDELLALYPDYKEYRQSSDEKYKEHHDRAGQLYKNLADQGIDICEMYDYRQRTEAFIKKINNYKKHIYVQKKVAARIENKGLVKQGTKTK